MICLPKIPKRVKIRNGKRVRMKAIEVKLFNNPYPT